MSLDKPHKWRVNHDAKCCVECGEAFQIGDKVYNDVALTIHESCLEAYGRSLKELGLL